MYICTHLFTVIKKQLQKNFMANVEKSINTKCTFSINVSSPLVSCCVNRHWTRLIKKKKNTIVVVCDLLYTHTMLQAVNYVLVWMRKTKPVPQTQIGCFYDKNKKTPQKTTKKSAC